METFEEVYPKHSFSTLVGLALGLTAWLVAKIKSHEVGSCVYDKVELDSPFGAADPDYRSAPRRYLRRIPMLRWRWMNTQLLNFCRKLIDQQRPRTILTQARYDISFRNRDNADLKWRWWGLSGRGRGL
jgi:hypothetical protein